MPEDATPPLVQPPPPSNSEVRTWNMLCHLSTVSGYLIPLGNFIGPLLIWQLKKDQFPSVEAHGKAALNFQITVFLAVLVGASVAFILSFFCVGFLLIPVVVGIALCGLIFPIIAAIKVNEGKEYKYPYSLELIK